MISLLHPSRGRLERSYEVTQKWMGNAGQKCELIVSIDSNDPHKERYLELYGNCLVSENRSAVDAINNAAKVSTGDILIVVSDDSDCPRNWVEKILNATSHKRDWMLKVNDGIQRWLITMPIMDRAYYNRFGYVYYPEYSHMFCDTELTHVADILNRTIKRNDLEFRHNHYSVTKAKRDEVSIKADATWNQGKQLYLQRVKESFGLKGVDVMNVSDNSHYRWLKQNLR